MSVAGFDVRSTRQTTRVATASAINTATKTAAWAVGGVAVFSSMHVADELWSRWDIGATQVTNSFSAGVVLAVPTIITLIALTGIMLMRRWGPAAGILLGIVGLWPPLTHVLDTHEMTAYRWTIEGLAALASLVLVVASIKLFTSFRSEDKS